MYRENGTVQILTKGDNNMVDDSFGIYAHGQQFLGREHIIGRAKAYVLSLILLFYIYFFAYFLVFFYDFLNIFYYSYFFFLFREVNMVAQVYALRWHGHYFNEWLSLLEICFDWSVRFVCIVYQRINNILITVSKRKAWWYVGFVY